MPAPGDRGGQVLELQQHLAAAGFDLGPADGVYGPRTRRAVIGLQQFCRLAVDGMAGPNTIKALALLVPHRVEVGRLLGPHFKEEEFVCRCDAAWYGLTFIGGYAGAAARAPGRQAGGYHLRLPLPGA